jgi:hypothetical protein
MPTPISISKEKPPYKSQDYGALLQEGIALLQKFSGGIWTDYNHHDPGVTILEYLCFGITDVGYRCNFPIQELLYAIENGQLSPPHNALFPPEKILHAAPTTIEDYVCLILDHCNDYIDYVWVEAVPGSDGLDGLYDIKIQLKEHITPAESAIEVEEMVRALFVQHRNLGEDVRSVKSLRPVKIKIAAEIEIEADASPNQVISNIILNLENYLNPSTHFYDFNERKAAGLDINEIFDGPITLHGFIDKNALRPQNSTIYVSKIRDLLTDTDGIRNVDQLKIYLNGLVNYFEEITLDQDAYFVVENNLQSESDLENQIVFKRNDQVVSADTNLAKQLFNASFAKEGQHLHNKNYTPSTHFSAEKRLEDISAYYSIQQFFPSIYGIGAFGIPRDFNTLRQAQARQLKGFLSLFEIMLASYLKQVSQLKYYFSTDLYPSYKPKNAKDSETTPEKINSAGPSYFAQFPFNIPDIEPLLAQNDPEKINQQLNTIAASNDQPLERRNQFLDHLLARFGESVNADVLRLFQQDTNDHTALQKALIEAKCRLLQSYDIISRDRGIGMNYLAQGHVEYSSFRKTNNVSGLKKKLCALLNLPSDADQCLTDFFPFEGFKTPVKGATQGISLKKLIKNGQHPDNYILRSVAGVWTVYFKDNVAPFERPILIANSWSSAKSQLNHFIEKIIAFDRHSSNFYLVEHILLRPKSVKTHKLAFEFPLPTGKIQFESPNYLDLSTLNEHARVLLMTIANDKNLSTLPDPFGTTSTFISIQYDGVEILRSLDMFPSDKANALMSHLQKEMLLLLQNDPGKINDYILPNKALEIKRLDDPLFYAHQISIVAPNWPGVFINKDLQLAFETLVAQHVPAQLRVEFHWLNWKQMQVFENQYFDWLEAKANTETQASELDKLAFEIALFLQQNALSNTPS